MKAYERARDSVVSLILSDEETNGSPALPFGARERIEEAIELVLINAEARTTHWRLLSEKMQKERHQWLLSSNEHDRVMSDGLSALSDSRLAALALNRFGLYWLARDIDDAIVGEDESIEIPETWLSIITRHGEAMGADQGMSLDDGQTALDAAFAEADRQRRSTAPASAKSQFSIVCRSAGAESERGILTWNLMPSGGAATVLGADSESTPSVIGELSFPDIRDSRISDEPIRFLLLAIFHIDQRTCEVTASLHYGDMPASQAGQKLELRADEGGTSHELVISYGGEFSPLNVAISATAYTVVLRIPLNGECAEHTYEVPFGEIIASLSNS